MSMINTTDRTEMFKIKTEDEGMTLFKPTILDFIHQVYFNK